MAGAKYRSCILNLEIEKKNVAFVNRQISRLGCLQVCHLYICTFFIQFMCAVKSSYSYSLTAFDRITLFTSVLMGYYLFYQVELIV